MRFSRLFSLLLLTLLAWSMVAQHRVSRIAADLLDTRAELERRLAALGETSGHATDDLGRAVALANDRLDALADTRSELASLRQRAAPDAEAVLARTLAPTVQLNGTDTVGSGTLIWSGHNARIGGNETYVLTAYHVVRDILAGSETARQDGIAHTIYLPGEKVEVRGDMVAYAERIDVALVKLRSTRLWQAAARVLPKAKAAHVRVTDPVYAAGCPLGNDPILTRGEISALGNDVAGGNYWMLTAPTYYGNSGGGIYLADSLQLLGVFSKIYSPGGRREFVVTHMGLCTPIAAVHEWLDGLGYGFVLEEAQAVPTTDPQRLAGGASAPAGPCEEAKLSKR